MRQLDIATYQGHIPPGYDYAIVVSAPADLSGVPVRLHPDGSAFTIVAAGSGRPVYRASYDRPFGVLEIEQPQPGSTLYATYWQSPSAAAGLRTVAPGLLAAQTGDIFIFNRETAMYGDVDAKPRPPEAQDPFRRALIPIGITFGLAVIGVLAVTARLASSAS